MKIPKPLSTPSFDLIGMRTESRLPVALVDVPQIAVARR
jgi:hypothetical protein